MKPKLLFLGRDLGAKARLDAAAGRAGYEVLSANPAELTPALQQHAPAVVVVDLDEGGSEALAEVVAARAARLLPRATFGFFSHVDEELGAAARAAGCDAMPRGRFWRSLDDLLAAVDQS